MLQYVNKRSNHPPKVIENIPASINKRLTQLSSNKKMFDNATNIYQDAITKSGYSFKLQYQSEQHYNQPKTRRKRNIIWYTPPYNKRVINNIGKTFLHLIDKEFTKDHPLHKLFNRNNVKISYSCMSNIKQTINMHNKSLLKPKPKILVPFTIPYRDQWGKTKFTCFPDKMIVSILLRYSRL